MDSNNKKKVFFTVAELAQRWGVSVQVVYKMVKLGKLTPSSKFSTIYFTLEQIELAEEGDCEPMSPLEKRKLEKKIAALEQQNEELTASLKAVVSAATRGLGF